MNGFIVFAYMQLPNDSVPQSLGDIIYTNFYVKSHEKLRIVLQPLQNYTIFLPSNITMETLVTEYGALVTKSGALADKGDFIQLLLDGKVRSYHV